MSLNHRSWVTLCKLDHVLLWYYYALSEQPIFLAAVSELTHSNDNRFEILIQMKNIRIQREHNLGQTECLKLAEKITDNLIARIGGTKSIDGNVIHYKHMSGSKGILISNESNLQVDVQLGLLVRSFGSSIEKEIHESCDKYLS